MNACNRPVTSREYKLMLNVERFKNREEGSRAFSHLIKFLIEKEGGKIIEEQDKKETRQTSYLDTTELALRQHGFTLRLREEADGCQVTLKYRSPDRYLAAAQDVSSPLADETKFEEDILPPFVSKFSHSTSVRKVSPADLTDMQQITKLFPSLEKLELGNAVIKPVGNFKAAEVVRKLCKFQFNDTSTIKACLSFWYLTKEEDDWPLVAEFSFDYDAPDKELAGDTMEMYPNRMVEGANGLFSALQSQSGWVNFNATTKTAFAFEVF